MDKTEDEKKILKQIDPDKIPAHVAIIMDGNGRWAQNKGLPRHEGHRRGVETVREIVRFSSHLGIKALTLFAFSTENWKRPPGEISFLMSLPEKYFKTELPELIRNNVRVNLLGDEKKLPKRVREIVREGAGKTAQNKGMLLNFALNYGARAEILQAVNRIAAESSENALKSPLSEQDFSKYLYTSSLPDPDLLIRTSGEYRISNFLLWQLAYSELWFTDIYWPDFTTSDLLQAIHEYQLRKRRFGKI